jgi:hypothetical protein
MASCMTITIVALWRGREREGQRVTGEDDIGAVSPWQTEWEHWLPKGLIIYVASITKKIFRLSKNISFLVLKHMYAYSMFALL